MLEIALIIANVGTAVVFFPILKRQSEVGAIGYVGARLVECMFIAIGIIAMLTFLFMMQEGTGTKDLGETFVAIYDRAFLVGPGFFAGFGNGLLLGWLMYRSELVPRGMAMLGLIGGPLVMASGIAIMLDLTSGDPRSRASRRSRSSSGSCPSASTSSSRGSSRRPSPLDWTRPLARRRCSPRPPARSIERRNE